MSEENVELVRRAYDGFRRQDIEAVLALVSEDVEWHSLVLEIDGVFRGHDGVREWWQGLRTTFPDWRPELLEARSASGNSVLTHARGVGRGASSGVGVDDDFWQLVEIQDGLAVRYQAFRTEQEALEAAGLLE